MPPELRDDERPSRRPGRDEAAGRRRRLGPLVRRGVPVVIGLAALAGLAVVVRPGSLAGALSRFDPVVAPFVVLLAATWFVLQGVRWHVLLRVEGSRLPLADSVLLSIAGQTITALLPLGDLTRAALVSDAAGMEFGTAAAAVTVQELTFTLYLLLLATPGMVAARLGIGVVAAVVAGVAAVLAVLTVPPLFRVVRRAALVLRLPSRLLAQGDALQRATARLLRRPDTAAWSALDLLRAVVGATVLWLILLGLGQGAIGWWRAAFVLAVAYVSGAVSFLPGGTGANDASLVGLLILLGVDPGTAGAAALLQRVVFTGLATGLGVSAYLVARRRFRLRRLLPQPAR